MIVLAIEIDLLHQELYPGEVQIDLNGPLQEVAAILINEGFWKN